MPEVTDLMRVAQYVKSDKTAPSDVYNAACRMLNAVAPERTPPGGAEEGDQWRQDEREIDGGFSGCEFPRLWPPRRAPGSNGDGRTPQTVGATEGQEAGEAQEAAKACEWFHWIGQSFATCDNCGRPAWDHRGHYVAGDPFTDEGAHGEEFKPGEADAIRAKWGGRK